MDVIEIIGPIYIGTISISHNTTYIYIYILYTFNIIIIRFLILNIGNVPALPGNFYGIEILMY